MRKFGNWATPADAVAVFVLVGANGPGLPSPGDIVTVMPLKLVAVFWN
jgi:hypothetical protein